MLHTENVTKQTLEKTTTKRNQSDLHLYLLHQMDATIIEIQRIREHSEIDVNSVKQMSSLFYRRNFLSSLLDNLENN